MQNPNKKNIESRTLLLCLGLFLLALTLVGCKEERAVVYSERIAILPDQSGYLAKEIRAIDKTQSEMVIVEIIGKISKDIASMPLDQAKEPKFRFRLKGDTIHLSHFQSNSQLSRLNFPKPAFTTLVDDLSETDWLSSGTLEGDPLFYDQEKWGALVKLVQINP